MSIIIVMSIYWGFAITAGFLFNNRKGKSRWRIILFNLLIFLPASLGLPLSEQMRVIAWSAAIGLTLFFALFPQYLPKWLTSQRVLCAYFGLVMMMIFLWWLFDSNIHGWYLMGIPALLAAVLNFFHLFSGLSRGREAV